MNLIQLTTAVKAHLELAATLSYVEAVTIRKYTKKSLPTFTDYCIIISPKSREKIRLSNGVFQYIYNMDIVGVVRNFDPELSLLGESPERWHTFRHCSGSKVHL